MSLNLHFLVDICLEGSKQFGHHLPFIFFMNSRNNSLDNAAFCVYLNKKSLLSHLGLQEGTDKIDYFY